MTQPAPGNPPTPASAGLADVAVRRACGRAIVAAIVRELAGRQGFDAVIAALDEETVAELTADCLASVAQILDRAAAGGGPTP